MNSEEEPVNNTPVLDTERYEFLMEESMKLYPNACMWIIHTAVCEQLCEEAGIQFDENDVNKLKEMYCNKLEYNNMITVEN